MDVLALTKTIADGLVPFIPALLSKVGTDAIVAASKKLGEDAWVEIKSVWHDILSRSPDAKKIEEAGAAVAGDPNDADAVAALRFQIRSVVKEDLLHAQELSDRLNRASSSMRMRTQTGSQIAVTDNASFTARDVDMSTRVGLTREELDDRDELATLKRILAQFDRRAIHDQMHEETIFFMTESLTQLRVNTQMIGVASLRNPAVRVLLKQMQEEIRDVETLAVIIAGKRPGQDWADSILDLRIFGGAQRDSAFRSQRFALQSRLDEAERFIHERIRHHFKEATDIDHRTLRERSYPPVENPSIPERKSLNSKQLANDVFCLYLFGAIDQLKSRILAKLEILQHELVK